MAIIRPCSRDTYAITTPESCDQGQRCRVGMLAHCCLRRHSGRSPGVGEYPIFYFRLLPWDTSPQQVTKGLILPVELTAGVSSMRISIMFPLLLPREEALPTTFLAPIYYTRLDNHATVLVAARSRNDALASATSSTSTSSFISRRTPSKDTPFENRTTRTL